MTVSSSSKSSLLAKESDLSMQVILIASKECGCLSLDRCCSICCHQTVLCVHASATIRELFKGRVNFLQLKQAHTCGINSRVERSQGNTVCTFLIDLQYLTQGFINCVYLLGFPIDCSTIQMNDKCICYLPGMCILGCKSLVRENCTYT